MRRGPFVLGFDARPWGGQTHVGSDAGAVGSRGWSPGVLTADPLQRRWPRASQATCLSKCCPACPLDLHCQVPTPGHGKRGAFCVRRQGSRCHSPRPCRRWQLGAAASLWLWVERRPPQLKGESDSRGPLTQPPPHPRPAQPSFLEKAILGSAQQVPSLECESH